MPVLTAADTFAKADRPLYQAQAREAAAAMLAGSGRSAEARDALTAALELYDRLHATWDATRATTRLRQAGVHSHRRSTTHRPRTGWESLTDTERKVATLLARGRSTPDIAAQLFISRRTVQSHVSRILAKLGCTSRADVALAAAGRLTD